MKIIIAGGSGQIGTVLARALHARGNEVTVLTRKMKSRLPWRCMRWDGRTAGDWMKSIDGTDAVINLSGRSVDCRYTAANRRAIIESRVFSTRIIGKAIQQTSRPPRVWLQASTATIYAHRYDAPNDEATGRIGGNESAAPDTWRFSIDVAMQWENAAKESCVPPTRLVLLRSAMTMSPDPGGVFDVLSQLVRRGLGGSAGDGTQFISWIHEADFVAAVCWLISHDEISGPVNLCSPHPIPNRLFMAELRRAWGVRFGLSLPGWMLELGAAIIRTETELILKSRYVVPGRLLAAGFRFRYPEWFAAAHELSQRPKEMRQNPSLRYGGQT